MEISFGGNRLGRLEDNKAPEELRSVDSCSSSFSPSDPGDDLRRFLPRTLSRAALAQLGTGCTFSYLEKNGIEEYSINKLGGFVYELITLYVLAT